MIKLHGVALYINSSDVLKCGLFLDLLDETLENYIINTSILAKYGKE